MLRKKLYFDDVFADIMLMHTLNHAGDGAASTHACRIVVNNAPGLG